MGKKHVSMVHLHAHPIQIDLAWLGLIKLMINFGLGLTERAQTTQMLIPVEKPVTFFDFSKLIQQQQQQPNN